MSGVDDAVNSFKQVVLELEQKMQSRTVYRVEQLQQIDELKAALSRQHELEEALLSVKNSLDSIISKLIDLVEDWSLAQVDVSVNGQSYRIACEDGQEDRLVDLAAMVDEKVIGLVNQIGQVGSNRLLVMAALIIADELVDLKNEAGSSQELEDNTNQQDTVLALQEITKRIENIADQVEQA